MSIQVYTLTTLGRAMARSTRSPRTPAWRIINYLDKVGHATSDQMAMYCGLGQGEVSANLVKLRHRRIVVEETGTEV